MKNNVQDNTLLIGINSKLDTILVNKMSFGRPKFNINDSIYFDFIGEVKLFYDTSFFTKEGKTISLENIKYPYKFWKPIDESCYYILKDKDLFFAKIPVHRFPRSR